MWLRLHSAWTNNDLKSARYWNDWFIAGRETAELRAEKQAVEFAARESRHAADLAVERTLADRMSARVDQMTADLAVEQAQRAEAEKRLAAGLARGWFKRRSPDAGQ